MIPKIVKLLSLDIYRDGGSLSALFSDQEDIQHELVFLIEHADRNSYEQTEILKYRAAVIKSFLKSEYVSPVTGKSIENTDIKEENISWIEATTLLENIKPFINHFQSEYLWVFESMLKISSNVKHEIDSHVGYAVRTFWCRVERG